MMSVTLLLVMMVIMFISKFNEWLKLKMQVVYYMLSFLLISYNGCYDYCWSKVNKFMMLGFDHYNYILVVFLFWLVGITLTSMGGVDKLIMLMFVMLSMFVLFTFVSMNLMLFYFFFEASLLPIFYLVVYMGSGYKRFLSGMYMLMYTLFFSLPMLVVMISSYSDFYSLEMIYLVYDNFSITLIGYLMFIMAFLVKVPMYTLHIWLPKAHVEAPCCGSMILAGILLKLGSYGLLRFMLMVLGNSVSFNIKIISYILVGSLVSSMLCLRQSDLKVLIAYSSVVHMGVMLGGMMTMTILGYWGSVYMMVGHGLCSSGLFYIVNVSYERIYSRTIYVNKGLINLMPSMTLWWFLLCSSNMAAPISLNLLSEIFLMMSLIMLDKVLMVLLMLISFLSACYSIYLFCSSQHGESMFMLNYVNSGKCLDFIVIFFHWLPLNIFVLNMSLIFY